MTFDTFNISHILKTIRNEIRNENLKSPPYKSLLRVLESKSHKTGFRGLNIRVPRKTCGFPQSPHSSDVWNNIYPCKHGKYFPAAWLCLNAHYIKHLSKSIYPKAKKSTNVRFFICTFHIFIYNLNAFLNSSWQE